MIIEEAKAIIKRGLACGVIDRETFGSIYYTKRDGDFFILGKTIAEAADCLMNKHGAYKGEIQSEIVVAETRRARRSAR